MILITPTTNYDTVKELNLESNEDVFLFISKNSKVNVTLHINKEGICANLYGIVIGRNNDVIDANIISNHNVGNSKSYVYIKSVILDKSIFNFNGLIKIKKNANLSDAYLKNDNLVISQDAKVNSKPQLEIESDDVKASHGVTIKTVSDQEKHYLMSRGLDNTLSQKLIIEGFIKDLTCKITNKYIKNKIATTYEEILAIK